MATGNTLLLDRELLKKTGVFALVSSEVVAAVGGGYFLGRYVDSWLALGGPVFAAGLAIIGFVYIVWRLNRLSQKLFNKPPNP